MMLRRAHTAAAEVIVVHSDGSDDDDDDERALFQSPVSLAAAAPQTQQQQTQTTQTVSHPKHSARGVPFVLHDLGAATAAEQRAFVGEWLRKPAFAFSLQHTRARKKEDAAAEEEASGNACDAAEDEDLSVVLAEEHVVEGVAVCWDETTVHWLPASPQAEFWRALRLAMGSGAAEKILYNMKPQLKILFAADVVTVPPVWDPKIAEWVIEMGDTRSLTLEQLVEKYKPHCAVPMCAGVSAFDACCARAWQSLILHGEMVKAATPADAKLLNDLEMPLLPIYAKMEFWGLGFSQEALLRQRQGVDMQLRSLEERAQKLSGTTWSLTSKEDAAHVLFEVLKLPVPDLPDAKLRKKRRRHQSTRAEVLEILAKQHRVPALLLQHRKLTHVLTMNIETLPDFAHEFKRLEMLRIHAIVLPTSTPTGRLSMTNTNLQSVVNDVSFAGTSVSIRSAFIAARGFKLLSSDYCQLEVRLMAHFSQDPLLLEVLSGTEDVFKAIASKWLDKSVGTITGADRQRAKGVCYGVLYGMGAAALSQKLGCTKDEATAALAAFKRKFSGVARFLSDVVAGCERELFVSTIRGRRRLIKGIISKDRGERKQAERQAVNTVCQGSGADIVKLAMLGIETDIRSRLLQSRLVHEMHDELLYEVPLEELAAMESIVRTRMESAVRLQNVPLPVQIRVGDNWGLLC